MSLEDEARSGRPLDATNEEMCKKVRDLVCSDRQIQVKEIAQALGIAMIFFLFFLEKICCGYSLEAPLRGASNEYPQHYVFMFHGEIRKNISYI